MWIPDSGITLYVGTMFAAPAVLPSPCIGVCMLDAAGAVCRGCGRTLAEIAAWTRFSDAERAAVMERLAAEARVPARHDAAVPAA